MVVIHGGHHGPWHGIRLEELRILVALSPARGVDLVVEGGVSNVDLTRVDPDNGSCCLQISPGILAADLSMVCTVLFVHLFDLEKEHSPFDYIIIKLVDVGYGGELGPGNFAERMEIEAVDGSNDEVDDYPTKGE